MPDYTEKLVINRGLEDSIAICVQAINRRKWILVANKGSTIVCQDKALNLVNFVTQHNPVRIKVSVASQGQQKTLLVLEAEMIGPDTDIYRAVVGSLVGVGMGRVKKRTRELHETITQVAGMFTGAQGAGHLPAVSRNSIFLSYRRDESADIAGRIRDRLVSSFGHQAVFQDSYAIPPGTDFPRYIQQALTTGKVSLVVIGRDWATIRGDGGRKRLDDPRDFVRIEIETALRLNLPIIPLLVHGAHMPRADTLPPSLRPLTTKNAHTLGQDPAFERDISALIDRLIPMVTR